MSEHPIADEIVQLIMQRGAWYEAFSHAPVRTSEEADALRPDYTPEQGAKSLMVRAKIRGEGKKFVMVVMPGARKFDTRKVKEALNANDMRFATEAEVQEITGGIQPGGIPPFGNVFNVPVLVDDGVLANDVIVFNAGRDYTIAMESATYRELVQPLTAEFSS